MGELKIDPNVKIIKNATRDDVRAGDDLTWTRTREFDGLTITVRHEGIAHHRDGVGDWCTKSGSWLTDGEDENTTLTIRRPARELPTRMLTVIVPNDGREAIEAAVSGLAWYASEAVLGGDGRWHAVWRSAGQVRSSMPSEFITPGTWKREARGPVIAAS